MSVIELAEGQFVPDRIVRWGIRRLLKRRLAELERANATEDDHNRYMQQFADQLAESPLRVRADAANDQHYEVPSEFFERCLGSQLKYSCCYFEDADSTLGDAEEAMLQRTCERAELADGMRILELGCGWGSLSLWMAQQYPSAHIVAVSNSHSQRHFIESYRDDCGLRNLEVITADMAEFDTADRFDRVVSVEMFEHMRNYDELLRRIAGWLQPHGKLMAHIFCHRRYAYFFETEGQANWMGRHFFTGGIMPSEDLLPRFQRHMTLEHQWRIQGTHYGRTAEAWLANLDAQREEIEALFAQQLPADESRTQVQRWRMFFMACAELFNYKGGDEWFVAHYLFRRGA